MKPIDINGPLRLPRSFWLAYGLLLGPVAWLSYPLYSDLPLYSKIAGLLFFPFSTAVLLYCLCLFSIAVVRDRANNRSALKRFGIAVGVSYGLLTIVWIANGFRYIPNGCTMVAVIVAILILQAPIDNDGKTG